MKVMSAAPSHVANLSAGVRAELPMLRAPIALLVDDPMPCLNPLYYHRKFFEAHDPPHNLSDPSRYSLDEVRERVVDLDFRVISAEDISELDLEYGWLPARKKLEDNEAHYRDLLGEEWVHQAYRSLEEDIAAWREGRAGNGRIVAVKGLADAR